MFMGLWRITVLVLNADEFELENIKEENELNNSRSTRHS